jgi:hypothetical protein
MDKPPSFFAQPQRARSNEMRAPSGFQYIHQGVFGRIFASINGTTVLKVFPDTADDAEVQKEHALLQALTECAPDYAPGPVTLTRVGLHGVRYMALQMLNAGNAISVLGTPSLPPLTPQEIALCLLQTIHCVLLVNDRMQMHDVHTGNLCVQWRGPDIRLRLIDVGMWEAAPPPSDRGGDFFWGIVSNADTLFWDLTESAWGHLLFDTVGGGPKSAGYDPFLADLLHLIETGAAIFRIMPLTRRNVYAALVQLAEDIRKSFALFQCAQQRESPDAFALYMSRIDTLLERIGRAQREALLQLPPQLHSAV